MNIIQRILDVYRRKIVNKLGKLEKVNLRDIWTNEEYDFSDELNWLRWFCILLSVNENNYLKTFQEKRIYLKKLLRDPLIRRTRLRLSSFNIKHKQKLLMIMVHLPLEMAQK